MHTGRFFVGSGASSALEQKLSAANLAECRLFAPAVGIIFSL
uniref:Uncharacterized protein n=1 Tax=Loigolactobacillus rennini TaxID=238013 RepID=A0A1K2I9S5_9LACO|nr:hypothetical protein LREN565_2167 [Loigolactobacillus rennini]